jgi:hypothetical protein
MTDFSTEDDDPEVVNRRDTIMVRLLHACARSLSERGMVGIYADGLKPNDYCLETLGKTFRRHRARMARS